MSNDLTIGDAAMKTRSQRILYEYLPATAEEIAEAESSPTKVIRAQLHNLKRSGFVRQTGSALKLDASRTGGKSKMWERI